ncbi:fatty acid desaturase [Hwanghaeella sp.]|uniref:fatty acid desaturase n=1 Tax=Hwanghaeella sp. TaxID=2605943 RepID=UPI003CCC2EAE
MRIGTGIAMKLSAVEWPTWLLIAVIYGSWSVLTYSGMELPWWILLPAGAFVTCWHGHLQHELIHGHPTRNQKVNDIIAFPPLSLWLPYPIYKEQHLAHHRSRTLADPLDDPESYYLHPDRWASLSGFAKAILTANNTLLGRWLLGPVLVPLGFLKSELRLLLQGDRHRMRIWLGHLMSLAVILTWIVGVCGLPVWTYLAFFVLPGTSLLLMRSFLEHRPGRKQKERTAIVEGSWLTRLLYLNNNLHVVHHTQPKLAWYRIPAAYERNKDAIRRRNGGYIFKGYAEIAHRYLLTPKDLPVYATQGYRK